MLFFTEQLEKWTFYKLGKGMLDLWDACKIYTLMYTYKIYIFIVTVL